MTYQQDPVGTVYRNPVTGTTYVKTSPEPGSAWAAALRGHAMGRVTSDAMAKIPGLVEMKEMPS